MRTFKVETFNNEIHEVKAKCAGVTPGGDLVFITEVGFDDMLLCGYAPRVWKHFWEYDDEKK
jgi:hypothetical protein